MRFVLAAQQIENWMEQFAYQYGYLGVFSISVIGALSVVFPVPYTIVIYLLGLTTSLDPFLIAVSGGLGSAVGEIVGYLLGYFGRTAISKERKRKMDFMLKVFSRYGRVTIFLFALTPLPDDLLMIPLGIMHYSVIRFFIPMVLGKTLMCFILAMGGRLSINIIKDMLGGEGAWWTTVASIVLLIAIVVVMLKVDWEKIFTQTIEKREKKSKN